MGDRPSHVLVYSTRILGAISWAVVLMSFSIVYWTGGARRNRVAVLVLATMVLVLLVPVELVPLVRGVFLGSLLASLVHWLVPWRVSGEAAGNGSLLVMRPAPLSTVTATSLLLAAMAWGVGELAAQPMDGRPIEGGRKQVIHPVLVPVDEQQQQPVGDYVYVSRALFDELHRRERESGIPHTGPLIERAQYNVALAPSTEAEGALTLQSMTAEFSLVGAAANDRLRLPFRRDRVRLGDIRLDGQPVGFEWVDNGQALVLAMERPGSRQLRINLRPAAMSERLDELIMPVPIVPRSRVSIRANVHLESVEVPSALGYVDRSLAGEVLAELGPARTLQVSWKARVPPELQPAEGEATERIWMHVQPSSIQLRGQFTHVARDGLVEFVDVEADPQLRWVPPTGDEPWHVEESTINGVRLLRCWLDAPLPQQATVELSFSMSGTIGNLPLPRLAARARNRMPTRLAISVNSDMDAGILPAGRALPLSPTEFAQSWASRDIDPPDLAAVLPDPSTPWQIALIPRPSAVSSEQEIDVSLGHGLAVLEYQAQFVAERGSVLQQQLRVPRGFDPREIIVIHDDINRLLRWAQVDDRTISLFFSVPLTGSYRMWVKGDLPLESSGAAEIPIIVPADKSPRAIQVRVYRHHDVQVQFDKSPPGLVADSSSRVPPFQSRQGRFVASWVADKEQSVEPVLHLRLAPNRPRTRGWLITTLSSRAGAWWAETEVHLRVENGFVDTVRLRLPAEMGEMPELAPGWVTETDRIPGERDRRLTIRLPEPESNAIDFRMRSRLETTSAGAVRVPDIQVLDLPSADLRRFVVLPRELNRRRLTWNTRGLKMAKLPTMEELPEALSAISDVYQVTSSPMQAELGAGERAAGTPRVQLAEYRYQWFDDGHYQGWAAFDFEPAGANTVTLDIPPGSTPVQVTAGGVVLAPRRLADHSWEIPIALRHLPQRIEVILHGKLIGPGQRSDVVTLKAPVIAGIPSAATLWTVQGPEQRGVGEPLLAHTRTDDVGQARWRLATAQALQRAEASGAGRESTVDEKIWNARWLEWMSQLEQDLIRAEDRASRPQPNAAAMFPGGSRYDVDGPWYQPAASPAPITRCALRGQADELNVRYRGRWWHDFGLRLVSAILVVAAVAATRRVRESAWTRAILRRYPHVAIGLLGVVWWLWLTPSAVGLALLLLAAGVALRPAWRSRPA
jgi:hypothetical protein